MTWKSYLLTLPERLFRSTVGLGAGVARELGDVVLPAGIRRTQLYQNLVATTLQFLIERVGGVENVYSSDEQLAGDFLVRRTAGNAVEVLGIVAFRASPVWVLAALADLCDLGRRLIPEIADALKAQGLLEQDASFASLDQLLDGLERTSSRMAATVNTPPLDVATLRQEWRVLREDARSILPSELPSRDGIGELWARLRQEAARQERSVFETSSMLALAAAGKVPDGLRWLSASARQAAGRTGQVFATALLDHYRGTLDEMRQAGYVGFAVRQLRPYALAAKAQFSPRRPTLTERLFRRRRPRSQTPESAQLMVGAKEPTGWTSPSWSCHNDRGMSDSSEKHDGHELPMKVVGRRRWGTGLVATAPLLELSLRLRGDKPFLPKGVHRFRSFEESDEWIQKMLTRPRRPGPRF